MDGNSCETSHQPAPAADDSIAELRIALAERDRKIGALTAEVSRLNAILAQRDDGIHFLRMEVARLSREPAEQRDWWDAQFAHCWENNAGPAQSRHFMQRLIANIPSQELDFLRSKRLRILDWGCATGDGLAELANAFPLSDAVGMDLSRVAVEKARAKYPHLTFVATDRGEIEGQVDVVVTSNCLEHFDAPLEWLERLLLASRSLVMVLVPFEEQQLMDGHKVSFSEDSFPDSFRGFTKLHARPIAVEVEFWAGRQLLVVYGSRAYMKQVQGNPAYAAASGA